MVRKERKSGIGAAERRIRALAPEASTLSEAVRLVMAELLRGVACPPTDLVDVGQRIGVREIAYESFPGSGELHRDKDGYRIICSSEQSRTRQRFTVAHELAHVILESTGAHAPRVGRGVERVCDMLAAECLLPTDVFEARLARTLTLRDVVQLARTFETSLMATARRYAEFRQVCVFGVTGDRVTWAYGGIRPGAVRFLLDQVRDGVRAVMADRQPEERVYFYGNGHRSGLRRFDWMRSSTDSAVFMLSPQEEPREVT